MGLSNPRSRSNYGPRLIQQAPKIAAQQAPVFLKFGQVDVEFVWIFDRIKKGLRYFSFTQFEEFCADAIRKYGDFIKNFAAEMGGIELLRVRWTPSIGQETG